MTKGIPILMGPDAFEQAFKDGRDSREVREKLYGEYEQARDNVIAILMGEQENWEIKDPDYLCPTVNTASKVPVNQEKGEVIYYLSIMSALETAFTVGKINEDALPPRAPQYLQDLVK